MKQARAGVSLRSKLALGLASILAAVAISFCAPGSSQGNLPPPDVLAPVVTEPVFEVVISFNGSLVFPESSREAFAVPGTVQDILVSEGDIVQQGQVLATLSEADLSGFSARIDVQSVNLSRQRQQLNPDVPNSIGAVLENADEVYRGAIDRWFGVTLSDADALLEPNSLYEQWGLTSLDAAFSSTSFGVEDDPSTPWNEVVLTTWRTLYPGRIEVTCEGGSRDLNTFCIDAEIDDAWVNLRNARNQYEQQQTLISSTEKNLARAMQNLEDVNLKAGTSGRIKEINLNEGDTVPDSNADRFIDIENTEIVEIIGEVQEHDIGLVREGQVVEVMLNAYLGTPFTGTVQKVSANSGLNFNVTTRLNPVEGVALFEGMNGAARISAASYQDVLLIPTSALNGPISTPYVLVRNADGSDARTPVTVGESDGRRVIVETGLNAGDMVVVPLIGNIVFDGELPPGERGPGGAPRARGNPEN